MASRINANPEEYDQSLERIHYECSFCPQQHIIGMY